MITGFHNDQHMCPGTGMIERFGLRTPRNMAVLLMESRQVRGVDVGRDRPVV